MALVERWPMECSTLVYDCLTCVRIREYNHLAVVLRSGQTQKNWVSQTNLKFSISNYQLIHIALNLQVLNGNKKIFIWFFIRARVPFETLSCEKYLYIEKNVFNSINFFLYFLSNFKFLTSLGWHKTQPSLPEIKTGGLLDIDIRSKNDIFFFHSALCSPLIMRGFVRRSKEVYEIWKKINFDSTAACQSLATSNWVHPDNCATTEKSDAGSMCCADIVQNK